MDMQSGRFLARVGKGGSTQGHFYYDYSLDCSKFLNENTHLASMPGALGQIQSGPGVSFGASVLSGYESYGIVSITSLSIR